MAKLIGTAGHVDHGKTSLIRALTGIDADRLPEEKKRGMTIDIGFAFLDLPRHGRVSIVDVPGHEKFIHNMLVGAHAIDVALLCVSADEAVMPQTREHFEILRLLPVDQMVVAMTRADLADGETRDFARLDIEELLDGSRFLGAPIIPVSAHTGEGLEVLKDELGKALDVAAERSSGPWYLPIDRVFGVKGHGCVVTGTLAQGAVKTGQTAIIEPGHHEVRVRAIHSHEEALETAERGRRTAINLGGIKQEDVHRGMVLGETGAVFPSTIFDAAIDWIEKPKHGGRVRVSIGAEEVIGRVFFAADAGDFAQFRLESEIACALNQPLIVRQYSPMKLLGGGRVEVPVAKMRRKSEAVARVSAGESDSDAILRILGGQELGVQTDELCRQLGKAPTAVGQVFEDLQASGQIRGFAGLWYVTSALDAAVARLLKALAVQHEQNPTQAYLPRERVLEAANLKWAGKPLDRIVSWLASEGRLSVSGTLIREPAFKVQLSARQREFLDRAIAALEANLVNVPSPTELAAKLGAPPQAVEEILRLGLEAREIVRVADGLYFSASQLDRLIGQMRTKFIGQFTAADFRDSFGTSRKYAIPLLEYLDGQRVTLRQGDHRVMA